MEKLINNTSKIIIKYFLCFNILYLFNSCNLAKKIIDNNEVVSVSLKISNNKPFLYIEQENIKKFIRDINKKELYFPKGDLIFSGDIIILFKNNNILNYEITNGGRVLFDGQKYWLLKEDIIEKYWFTLEENRFIIPTISNSSL